MGEVKLDDSMVVLTHCLPAIFGTTIHLPSAHVWEATVETETTITPETNEDERGCASMKVKKKSINNMTLQVTTATPTVAREGPLSLSARSRSESGC